MHSGTTYFLKNSFSVALDRQRIMRLEPNRYTQSITSHSKLNMLKGGFMKPKLLTNLQTMMFWKLKESYNG